MLNSAVLSSFMEFLNGDEHFKEFERVFETVNNRKDSKDLDVSSVLSPDRSSKYEQKLSDEPSTATSGQQPASRQVGGLFADFFDNDETFLEFEKEFEKFRSNRRSNLFGGLGGVGSSRDIFGDVKSYCERSIESLSGPLAGVSSCSSLDEATPSCGEEASQQNLIWRSVEDWEKMLRKMRRNSRLLLETCNSKNHYQHRHSVAGHYQVEKKPDMYQKTQSLADLSDCHASCYDTTNTRSAVHDNQTSTQERSSQFGTDLSLESSSDSQCIETVKPVLLDNSSLSIAFSSEGEDDSSSGQWSETFDDDSRYSSSSTLCSGNDDLCCSFSCSFCSEALAGDDTDDDMLMCEQSPPARRRSHSLMELRSQVRPASLFLHATSADSLLAAKGYDSNCLCQKNTQSLAAATDQARARSSQDSDQPYLDDDTPTDDDDSIASRVSWGGPPSTVSSQLSDAESEQYHTALSDLSDHYSTAKTCLSSVASEPSPGYKSRSLSVDLSLAACPRTDAANRVFEWTQTSQGGSDKDLAITRGQYNSYHGREDVLKNKYGRLARCGSACQYTCHQHCVPAVTLNCKSISDDGYDVGSAARTPSPSDPRSHLETSLSVGNVYTRPGCARMVSSRGDTATVNLHNISDSVLNFQHVAKARAGGELSDPSAFSQDFVYKHTDTPRPAHLPSHYLSRSASEGYVTTYSSTALPSSTAIAPPSHSLRGHHVSSSPWYPPPPLLPSHSASQPGPHNIQQTHAANQPQSIQPESMMHVHEQQDQGSDDLGVYDKIIQGDSISDNTDNNNSITQQLENSEDKLSDLQETGANQEATTEKDETDSGYRSGTIPDDKLPRIPSQATLDRQELSRKIAKYNHFVPAASLEVTGKESFQGFVKVTMNLIRPITMELGARPPSIYELLTKEHIVEENTQQVAFYMPRDTHKSLHITSVTTTKEVVTSLLKKFHILDHPRKFAIYEQEFNDRNKLVRLRRLTDKDFPLHAILSWDPERIRNYRMVLQENETGEIVWDAFSLPELGNFLKVLDREEKEMILELKHKYAYMKQYMERRLAELRNERNKKSKS